MSEHHQTLRDDISFMRQLAEEGRVGGGAARGWIMIAAGLCFGGATLGIWAASALGVLGSGQLILFAYVAGSVVFAAIATQLRRQAGERNLRSRGMSAVWNGVAWAIWAIVAGLILLSNQLHNWNIMGAMPTVTLALYGAAWLTSAVLTEQPWQRWVGWAALASAVLMGWMVTQAAYAWLVFAAALLVLLAGPGVVMVRKARG